MKLLFVHSIRLYKDDFQNLYTHSSYNNEVWKRYLSLTEDLTVVTRKTKHIYDKNEAIKKFEKFDADKMSYIEIEDIYQSISSFISMKKRIRNNKSIKRAVKNHDYIIARLPSYAGYKAVKYAKKYNKPYLIEIVACPWDGLINHSLRVKWMAPLAYLKLRRTSKNAEYALYVTNSFLQNRYPTTGRSVGCSDVLLKEVDEKTLIKRLDKIKKTKEKDLITIGTTAAVDVKYKGQQYIIKALGNLKAEGITNFEYQLVGGGNQSYLKKLAKEYDVEDQVNFIGQLPHEKVFDWLESIDIYAQPSKTEGMPRSLIEAMSMGIPSIGSRAGGIPELLDEEFLFDHLNNVEEICTILKELNVSKLVIQAKRNFNEAKKYEQNTINEKRKKFFKEFVG